MKASILILVISCFFFCQEKETDNEVIITESGCTFFEIIEPLPVPKLETTFSCNGNSISMDYDKEGNYTVNYIGPHKEKILLSDDFFRDKRFTEYRDIDTTFRFQKDFIELVVDTSQQICKDEYFYQEDKEIAVNSYPIIINNYSKQNSFIGFGEHIPLYMEAIHPDGKWKSIEEMFVYECGTGLNGIHLPPSEIVITLAPVYQGDYKTKLRLRFGEICSNEFTGTINLAQFRKNKRY